MALTDNLIFSYEMNSATGVTADAHSTNTLTNNGGVTTTTGKIAEAANFVSASTQYLSIASNANIVAGDFAMTFEVWFWLDSTSAVQPIFCKISSFLPYALYYDNVAGHDKLVFDAYFNNQTVINTFSPTTGIWYQAICKYYASGGLNKTLIKINNGTAVETANGTFPNTDGGGDLRIGRNDAANYLDGRVDMFRMWKRNTSDAEDTQLYNAGAGLAYANFAGGGADVLMAQACM